MLEALLRHLRNWFVIPNGVREGTYTIEGGTLEVDGAQNGQFIRICGSTFNDGLYCYPAEHLTDETFEGAVWLLAIPAEVLDLADDIATYQAEHGAPTDYVSESFGGYTYTRAQDAGGTAATWPTVFRSRLNPWRKM